MNRKITAKIACALALTAILSGTAWAAETTQGTQNQMQETMVSLTGQSFQERPPMGPPPGNPPMGQPPQGKGPMQAPPGGFGARQFTQGTAATNLKSKTAVTGKTYRSAKDSENALRVTGADVTLDDVQIEKTAGKASNTEAGDFWGENAAFLATDKAQVTIRNAKVHSSARNGNGVFSYGKGTKVTISDSVIETTGNNSGGIQTTGGGTTCAANLQIHTTGNSAASIRSDRGGGTVVVDGGTYKTEGYGSPAIYSTADITVKNAVLDAANSEAAVIEGKNAIHLENCTASGRMSASRPMPGRSGTQNITEENIHTVMIYQSMSGDAEQGKSHFSMQGGSLTGHAGDLIYVTNTSCDIVLDKVQLVQDDAAKNLLLVAGNSAVRGWGTAGKNGGTADVTLKDMTLQGNLTVDTVSRMTLTLAGHTKLDGTIRIVENAEKGKAVPENAVVTLKAGSTWNLTDDASVTSLTVEPGAAVNRNGHRITLADGTEWNG
ncbi:MAG: hypothetical protein VZQ81_08620 [Succiniclasticum sp.]|jgi:hypothetical protein|nr:hypothetical protein [Succiniclasticum sp.]MEE3480064.1 hypothetical protein [Succiniclasticum sp.]